MTTGSTKTAARRCGMNKPFALVALVALLARASVAADATPSLRLGADLARASDWTGAAVEFRRSALLAESDPVRAQSLWLAGWSYAQTQDWARAEAARPRPSPAAAALAATIPEMPLVVIGPAGACSRRNIARTPAVACRRRR